MSEGHPEVFRLVILAAVVVSMAVAGICPYAYWQYHDLTGTCMALVFERYTDFQAEGYCENFKGGINGDSKGHLVHIFNEKTDTFVKELLKKKSVSVALIGLHDRKLNGWYTWSETGQEPGYTGWKRGLVYPQKDTTWSSVIITAEGWEEYDKSTPAYFVCQVAAVFPIPTIDCPIAEVGQNSSGIKCTVNVPANVTFKELTVKSSEKVIASCNSQSCSQSHLIAGDTAWSLAISLRKVERSYEGSWSCSVKFSSGHQSESSPCEFKVYSLPANVQCQGTFLQSRLEVSCTTNRMYPQAACNWGVTNDRSRTVPTMYPYVSSTVEYDAGVVYYRSVCSVSVDVLPVGVYLFTVSVRPDLPGLEKIQASKVKTGSVDVTVELPKDPLLYDSSWSPLMSQLKVLENQNFTINCRINGGIPPVYITTISCDHLGQPNEQLGESNFINIRATHVLHGRKCSCMGQHLSGVTKSSSVTFLVISPPRITSFSINSYQEKVQVFLKSANLFLKCTSTGYPSQLSLLYYQDGKVTNKTESSNEVSHTMTATCSSMGRYACVAENPINNVPNKDSKYIDVHVQCDLEHCPHKGSFPKYGAAVGSNSSFNICVQGYPAPTSIRVIIGEYTTSTSKYLERTRYEASFSYTDEVTGQADIKVTIFSVTRQDLGVYQLYSETRLNSVRQYYSYLKFELIPRGPPSCPENLTVSKTFSDSVTLSWQPGFDGGGAPPHTPQKFTVLRYVSSLTGKPHSVSGISQTSGNSKDVLSYNITGLSASTKYIFSIQAENEEGVKDCPHLLVDVSTEASSLSSSDLTAVVVPVFIGLVILVVVAVVFVLVRRRRSRAEKLGVVNTDTVETSTIYANSSCRNDGQEIFYANVIGGNNTAAEKESKEQNLAKGSTGESKQDNTYAEVNKQNKKKAQKESKEQNVIKRSTGESNQDNTYAQVNKQNKKKVDKRPIDNKQSLKNIEEEDNTYIQFTGKSVRKGKESKEKKSKGKGQNNEEVTYSSVSKLAAPKTGLETDHGSVYANMASSSKTENEQQSKARNDGRTVNQDGLIYSEVIINKKTTNPDIILSTVPKHQPPAKIAKMPAQPREQATEYVALDFTATARQK